MLESQKIELEIQACKNTISILEKLEKLEKNPEFIELITQGFCLHEVARNITNSVDTRLPADARNAASETAKAAGYLKQYLEFIHTSGNMARSNLAGLEQYLIEVRQNELNPSFVEGDY